MTTSVPSPLDQLKADLAGLYRVEGEIGAGATATVYRAFDLKHSRDVAIKLLKPELAATVTGERFQREISIAAHLQHPHILPVLDSGAAGGSYYFVMPLVDGESLRERLRRGTQVGLGEVVRVLLDVADALGYAHRHGVVHRDIKPDNIMLTGRHAVVTDFGVAKALNQPTANRHLTTGVAIGTPAYMAPEQAMASDETDHRADLYALGIVGYELLAGRPPFTGATPQEVLTAQVVLTPEPLRSRRSNVPAALAEVIDRCLAKAPADRWQSAAEIVNRLDSFATPSGELTPAALAKPRRRMPWVAAIGVIAVVMALLWGLTLRQPAETPATAAAPDQLSFLGTVREASLSPDGSFLAYVTADSTGQRLWIEDAKAGGRPVELSQSERIVGISWIRAGTEISFAEGPAEHPVTRAISRFGGTNRIVGQGRGIISPNGDLILIATGGDPRLRVIRPAANDTIHLRRPGDGWLSGISWSPTSDRFAMTILSADRSRSTIVLMGLDGTATTVAEERRMCYGPTWAPNGQSLYYLAAGRQGRDLLRLDLKKGNPSTPVAAGLSVLDESRRHPTGTFLSIAPDERSVVFVEEEQWSNLARFSIGPGKGAAKPEPELFTMGTALYSSARLSPDGTQLAVFMSTARGTRLGTVAVSGNAMEQIAIVDGAGQIAWSPDGSAIAYTGVVGDSGVRLSVFDRATGATRRAVDPAGLELTWGANGIVTQRPGNHGLLLFNPRTLTSAAIALNDSNLTTFNPRVSPDTGAIAMLAYTGGTGPVSLAWYDVKTRAVRPLSAGAYRPLGWSADGTMVFAARNSFAPAPEEVVAVPLKGGAPQAVTTLPPGFYSEDMSTNGRLLIATQLQSKSESWRLALPSHR